jgi:hypothetical protein
MNGILWQGRSFAEAHLLPMSRTRSVIYVLTAPRIPLNHQLSTLNSPMSIIGVQQRPAKHHPAFIRSGGGT